MDVSTGSIVLWVVVPYACLAILVVGSIWRYRYDKFGWTTRSSELYEKRLLRMGSPLFHFGLLAVIAGHFVGLVIPESWTDAAGVSEAAYHFLATWMGTLGAVALVTGLVILIYRRRSTGPVFLATTKTDKLMYVMLAASVLSGAWATVHTQILAGGYGYNYRENISPWFRTLFTLQPDPLLMVGVPVAFGVHITLAMLLFAVWPFTRLVHAFSAPVSYPFRPYIVYRSRDAASGGGARAPRPGWEPSTTRRDRR